MSSKKLTKLTRLLAKIVARESVDEASAYLGEVCGLDFLGCRYGFDINDKGDGIENGPIHTLAGEMPRAPIVYGEAMQPERQTTNRAQTSVGQKSVS